MTRPLEGVHVVEAGPVLPVPATGANLLALGARVTRLDPPGGNPAERLYGGWLAELYGRGKDAVALDLGRDDDQRARDGLLDTADVVVTGFRPAALDRMGLSAQVVRAQRPHIVHCSIVGYSSTSPRRDEPGHDLSFLADCGALATPATPSAEGLPPRRPAPPFADLAASATATQAVLAALLTRYRTGVGTSIEVPIADVVLGWMAPRLGHAVHPRFFPALDPANDLYQCVDGAYVAVAAIEPKFWSQLVQLVQPYVAVPAGCAEWSQARRVDQRRELSALLAQAFAQRTSAQWRESAPDLPLHEVRDEYQVVDAEGRDLDHWRRLATPLAQCLDGVPR